MDMLSRLWRLVSITLEQQRTVEEIYLAEGVCSCGRPIGRMDSKIVMSFINSSWSSVAGARNTMAIGIYCSWCANKINMCFKSLKKLPERDKLKSHPISGSA